jgi:hypothetical protein
MTKKYWFPHKVTIKQKGHHDISISCILLNHEALICPMQAKLRLYRSIPSVSMPLWKIDEPETGDVSKTVYVGQVESQYLPRCATS